MTQFLVFWAGKDQAGEVEHLVTGQPGRDGHDQVSPGLDPDDGRGAGPADYSRGHSCICWQ